MTDMPVLHVRGLRGDDWAALYPWWQNEDALHDSLEMPYPDEDGFRDRFANPPDQQMVLVGETGEPSGRKRLVGVAWLTRCGRRRRHAGELRLMVYPDFRRTALEAALLEKVLSIVDRWWGLHRLELTVFAEDEQRRTLYEAHGFVVEARMRCYAWRDGALADGVLMARLRQGEVG